MEQNCYPKVFNILHYHLTSGQCDQMLELRVTAQMFIKVAQKK